jgi:hypothetical protein
LAIEADKNGDCASAFMVKNVFKIIRIAAGVSSQVITLLIAKSQTRSKQNKDMHKFSSVYSKRGVPLPVLTSDGE